MYYSRVGPTGGTLLVFVTTEVRRNGWDWGHCRCEKGNETGIVGIVRLGCPGVGDG